MKPQTEHATIKMVAQKAGVSVATAARVMGKYGSVSEETKARVIKTARELSYVPNAIAKSMRKQCTKTIGLIMGDIQAPFFSKIAFTIEEVFNRAGYNVLICNTNERSECELHHLRSLYERRVDGIIISSAQRYDRPLSDEMRGYYESDTPTVFVDRKVEGVNRPLVECDNLTGSYRAGKYLLDLGHRRIGVIASNQFINSTKERIQGFQNALSDYGVTLNRDMIRFCEESFVLESGRLVTQDLLSKHPDVTALYLLNHPVYKAAWFELKARSFQVPKDISVLGWGDAELSEAWDMSAVTQPIREIGVCAAEMLLEMIDGRQRKEFRKVIFETRIIHRSSCAKPRVDG